MAIVSRVINVPLIVNPLNWITVFLMVTVALFGVDAVVSAVTRSKSYSSSL